MISFSKSEQQDREQKRVIIIKLVVVRPNTHLSVDNNIDLAHYYYTDRDLVDCHHLHLLRLHHYVLLVDFYLIVVFYHHDDGLMEHHFEDDHHVTAVCYELHLDYYDGAENKLFVRLMKWYYFRFYKAIYKVVQVI